MKNRVNISKLIEEKYKNDAFSFKQLNEMIDSVLNESDQSYLHSKTIPANLEENPESVNISQRMYGAQGIRNEIPDELGYGDNVDNVPQVRPDKLAERDEENQAQLSTARQRTIVVPDLFSMITSPKSMSVGNDDRDLINGIIANIGLQQSTSWREKIRKLQEYVINLSRPSETPVDITQTVSGLIFLNLFKKMSFFMDQPGKQFEYLFLPFLSPTAEVKGSESEEISDVVFDGKEYSLKFLTSSSPRVIGSRDNLSKKVQASGYATYLVARVIGTRVEFAEFAVTNSPEFAKTNYLLIPGQKTEEKGGPIWFVTKVAEYPRYLCLIDSQIPVSDIGYSEKDKLAKEKEMSYFVGGKSFPESLNKKLRDLIRNIESSIKVEKPGTEKYNKAVSLLKDNFPNFQNEVSDTNSREQVLKYIQSLRDQIVKSAEKISQIKGENPPVQEAVAQKGEAEKIKSSGKFNFSVKGIWPTIVVEKLEIGSPEVYNKQAGFVAGEISNFYVDILESLDKLSKSVTNYVATSSDTQKNTGSKTYAQQSKDNAEAIVNSVTKIEEKNK